MAKGKFSDLMNMEWADECPKPWMGETGPGKCTSMMACRANKYLNFFNMSHWAPNVEVRGCVRGVLGMRHVIISVGHVMMGVRHVIMSVVARLG